MGNRFDIVPRMQILLLVLNIGIFLQEEAVLRKELKQVIVFTPILHLHALSSFMLFCCIKWRLTDKLAVS